MFRLTIILSCLIWFLNTELVTAQSDCVKQVQAWEKQSYDNLKNKYIKKEGLGFAADDPWENIICNAHSKRKCNVCRNNYINEQKSIVSQAENKYKICQENSQKAVKQKSVDDDTQVANEKAKIETQKEQKARIEREKNEKAVAEKKLADEKANKENANLKNNKDKSTVKENSSNTSTASTYVESDEARKIRERAEVQRNKDKAENETMTAIGGSVAASMEIFAGLNLDNDLVDEESILFLKGNLALGLQNFPGPVKNFV